MMNTKAMPADEHVSHVLLVLVQLLDAPLGRIDDRHHVDVNESGPRIEAESGIDLARNPEKEGHDGRSQADRQMKGALVEVTDFAGGDAYSFRAQIYRFASSSQDAIGALEDPDALRLPSLRHG